MAFDLSRALDLGRQALRLAGAIGGDADASRDRPRAARQEGTAGHPEEDGAVFDLGLPPRQGAPFDPGAATQCWPVPGSRTGMAAGAGTPAPGRPSPHGGDSRADSPAGHHPGGGGPHGPGVPGTRPVDSLLPDFTGRARVEYAPDPGPVVGPGEIVWTWVPFEEMDGRGKDRPVLVVGRDGAHLLALMLTSKDHTTPARRDEDYVDVGTGPWDRTGRASEAKLDRVLRVDPAGVRRDGGVLDAGRFAAVADALAAEQGWER